MSIDAFLPIPKQTNKEHREELLDPLFCVNFDAVCGLFLMEDNYYIFFVILKHSKTLFINGCQNSLIFCPRAN